MALERATVEDAGAAFGVVAARVGWMAARGIAQWNATGYLESYPEAYFRARGELYVVRGRGGLCGVVVLLESDPRWCGQPPRRALYVHNLATDPRVRGVGRAMLGAAVSLARARGLTAVRLDCAAGSGFLRGYYASMGFVCVGDVQDGPYAGLLLELDVERAGGLCGEAVGNGR